jgi:putative transcriptional regulator
MERVLYINRGPARAPLRRRMRNQLRELRAARGWSQADLATELGVSRQTVNAIETERYDPSLPLAFKIARLFGRPLEKIFQDG